MMDADLPTRLDCITALRASARELGTSPTCKAYIRSGRLPCYVTIRRLLGYSWTACLEAADLAPAEWPPPAAEPVPEPEPTIPEPTEPPLAAVPLPEAVRAMLGQVRAEARAAESHSTKYRQQGQLAAQQRHVRAGLGTRRGAG